MTWDPPATLNGVLTRYSIYLNGQLWWASTSQPPLATFYLVGLQPNTDYAVWMSVRLPSQLLHSYC